MASLSFFRIRNLCRALKPTALNATPTKSCLARQIRYQSQFPSSSRFRSRTQYNRFTRGQTIKYLWQNSPGFRYGVGALGTGGVGFVAVNMETVPVSGRKRFNWVSPEKEEQLGSQQFHQVVQQFRGQILPAWHPKTKMVHRVLDRLIPASGLVNQAWEVYVIDDPSQMNAFVIPGLVVPQDHGLQCSIKLTSYIQGKGIRFQWPTPNLCWRGRASYRVGT